MNFYKSIIKPALFKLDAEKAHHFVFSLLGLLSHFPFLAHYIKRNYTIENKNLEREVFGLKFKNPVGLAAGFDKDARRFNELGLFGFGFIEVGTVTPLPQDGNGKPRLFRLPKDAALINRMGFNNGGVFKMKKALAKKSETLIIGGNIGKNKNTPNDKAIDDYKICLTQLFDHIDYFVVNVSSPNTPGLRELQEKEPLKELLTSLQELNKKIADEKQIRRRPLLLKIAPDLNNDQLDDIIEIVLQTPIDGLVATNTTISRTNLITDPENLSKIGAGGLSGKPLQTRSTEIIRYITEKSEGKIPVIGAGGIFNAKDAIEKLNAGACLIQVYSGFVYEGPSIVNIINRELTNYNFRLKTI